MSLWLNPKNIQHFSVAKTIKYTGWISTLYGLKDLILTILLEMVKDDLQFFKKRLFIFWYLYFRWCSLKIYKKVSFTWAFAINQFRTLVGDRKDGVCLQLHVQVPRQQKRCPSARFDPMGQILCCVSCTM